MGLCYSSQSRKKDGIFRSSTEGGGEKYFPNKEKKSKSNLNELALNNDVIISGNNINPEAIYQKKKVLGVGAFGEVWLVYNKDLDKDFAMKIIKKRKNIRGDEQEIKNEIDILKKLDHPKILKILDFYSTPTKYYLVTEYCPEGELFNEITTVGKFNEGQAAFIIYQLLTIIKYCHKMHIIHRDIKPENVMISKREKNGCLQVKLIDFGTAKIYSDESKEKGYVGSSYYMAPEVIQKKYDEKCDLWSIGVIMYILLTGRPPFDGENDKEILQSVLRGKYDTSTYPYPLLSSQAKELIKKLLEYNPLARINSDDALNHDWFKTEEFKNKNKVNCISKELAKELINNLVNYKSDNMLKVAVIAYLVHNNTNVEQCVEASKLYNNIDLNHDGKIEQNELEKGLQEFWNLSEEEAKKEAERIFKNIDTDHNGYIEHEEFLRAAVNTKIFINEDYLHFAFNYFDTDQSGDITFNEIKEKFTQNSKNKSRKIEKELKKIFEKIDLNNDGSISFEEFCSMMKDIISS